MKIVGHNGSLGRPLSSLNGVFLLCPDILFMIVERKGQIKLSEHHQASPLRGKLVCSRKMHFYH